MLIDPQHGKNDAASDMRIGSINGISLALQHARSHTGGHDHFFGTGAAQDELRGP